jgi:Cdc6-like AAA superfamily ATPase
MKKCLIAVALLVALAGCDDHSDLKRGIMECKTAAEIGDVGMVDEETIDMHRKLMEASMNFEITAHEFKDLRSQISKDWRVDSMSEQERQAKAKSVLHTPKCQAMLR